jgi:hypothetical protein
MMSETIEQSRCHLRIAEYRQMPQRLIGESLKFGSSIRTIRYMATAIR